MKLVIATALSAGLLGCPGSLDDPAAFKDGSPSSGSSSPAGSSDGAAFGAGSGGADGATPPATFDTLKLVLGGGGPIMACNSAPCHAAGGMAPPGDPLTLAIDDQLYTNLTTHISKNCGNIPVVNPGKPDESALVTLLRGPCLAADGGVATPRMPYQCSGSACIPDAYIAAVGQWIANGAPQQ